jgi:hypothetical protein
MMTSALTRRSTGVSAEIRAGDLNIDLNYQRIPDSRRIAKMSAEWDWFSYQPICAGCRDDGSYWIIDGQHRWAAAMKAFDQDVLLDCYVHLGTTSELEADRFLRLNGERKGVSLGCQVKAGAHAGDPAKVAIKEVLAECGIDYVEEGAGRKRSGDDAPISCWGAMEKIYKDGQDDALRHTIMFLENAWNWSAQSVAAYSVAGTWLFLKKWRDHPSFSTPDTAFRLGRMGWTEVQLCQVTATKLAGRTLDRSVTWAKALQLAHDKGLRDADRFITKEG